MLSNILTLIVGVAGVVATLVAPLYYLVLDMRSNGAEAAAEREAISDAQDSAETDIDKLAQEMRESHRELHEEVSQIRAVVETNANRSEMNQKHIHQILVGEHNMGEDEDDIANPHYTADHCPLPDECPFCLS